MVSMLQGPGFDPELWLPSVWSFAWCLLILVGFLMVLTKVSSHCLKTLQIDPTVNLM